MERTFDFVVVGAGQNNLTAAAYLAKAGNSVLVLERHPYYGGGCITQEVTVPGFRHDLHATNIFLAQANPLLRRDELGLKSQFGLAFAPIDGAAQGTIFDDGSSVQLYLSMDKTLDAIASYCPEDAEAYRELMEKATTYMRVVSFGMFLPPANPDAFMSVLKGSAVGQDLLNLFNASAWEVISTRFKDVRTRVHLLRLTTEFMMLPESPGTAFALVLMSGLYHSYTCGIAVGGSQSFADALVRCIRHHGGIVETGVEASRIETRAGRATAVVTADGERIAAREAVIAGIPPWKLDKVVDGVEALARKADQVPASDYTCFLTHLALAEPPRPISAPEFHNMCFTIVAERDDEKVLQMARDVTAGRCAQGFSSAYVCATNQDPSRAPAGKATLYLYHIAPTRLAGKGENGWDEIKGEFGQWLIDNTRRYVPNLTPDNILGVSHCSPLDIARESASYKFGDVAGLATTPDQLIYGRPMPELAQFRVPGVEGLYLCGPFMHPGGGANGGGRAVAMRVMMDRGMELKRAFML